MPETGDNGRQAPRRTGVVTPTEVPGDVTKGHTMAAMKPRTGDGPLEVVKEGRGIVLRMPLEGGGRLVVEMTPDEVKALGEAIDNCEGLR